MGLQTCVGHGYGLAIHTPGKTCACGVGFMGSCSDVLAPAWGQAGPDLWPETAFGLAWILSKPEPAAWAMAWNAGSKIVGDVLNLSFNFFFLVLYSWNFFLKKNPTYPNTASLSCSGTHADNELFINLESVNED